MSVLYFSASTATAINCRFEDIRVSAIRTRASKLSVIRCFFRKIGLFGILAEQKLPLSVGEHQVVIDSCVFANISSAVLQTIVNALINNSSLTNCGPDL